MIADQMDTSFPVKTQAGVSQSRHLTTNMRDLAREPLTMKLNHTITQTNVIWKKLQNQKMQLGRIELLLFFTASLLIFLEICGSYRRRYQFGKFRFVLWAAYTLSSFVITYTLGLMHEAQFRNQLLPLWATFLMIIFGSANSFSAYSLDDHERWKTYNWQHLMKNFGFLALIIPYFGTGPMIPVVECLYGIVLVKFTERSVSLKRASTQGLQKHAKQTADYYMTLDRELLCDPGSMKGYTYLVRGDEKKLWHNVKEFLAEIFCNENAEPAQAPSYHAPPDKERVITVEMVWECKGWLLRSDGGDPNGELKDICLSFALFKLLRLRFASYTLPKEAHVKAWKLIQHLLSQDGNYERAFRVAEVELEFLFEFFYTKYPTIFHPGWKVVRITKFLTFVVGSILTILFLLLLTILRPKGEVQLASPNGVSIDTIATMLMLGMILLVEVAQFHNLLRTSKWFKMHLLCSYVKQQSWQKSRLAGKLIRWTCNIQSPSWERKLHQYVLLENYDYRPSRCLYNACTASFIDQKRAGQKRSCPIMLSSMLRKAVFRSLIRQTKGQKGEISLGLNIVSDDLLWACEPEMCTQIIMVWHIATSICEYKTVKINSTNFRVATNLSKYLAYLVVFAPKLLPDHPYEVEHVFNQIILEARKTFKNCKGLEQVIDKLEEIADDDRTREMTVIERGALLGKQLMNEPGNNWERVWRMLAAFWADLVLYVAPSNSWNSENAKAHAERLAMGGEFVTHLWALLSHAGIERQPRPPTIRKPTLRRCRSWSCAQA